ncbi:hypothetical protein ACFSKL_00685 [Belliella marina]|uniref:Uncharacterized protein n=1 Tax=Belliella marina TaxID=1644146 RepID=A0ABW4VHT9_9BACT
MRKRYFWGIGIFMAGTGIMMAMGIIPNPFGPPIPVVPPEGFQEAIPNPFEDEHIASLRHGTDRFQIKWHWKGKEQEILPILEQGNIPDDFKYFETPSQLEENPEKNGNTFRFDYEIKQKIKLSNQDGIIRYKVNSADNSMYFPKESILSSNLFKPLTQIPKAQDYDLHFAILNKNRELMLFAQHPKEGKICVYFPTDKNFNQLIVNDYIPQIEFLQSVKNFDHIALELDEDFPLEPFQGEFTQRNGHKTSLDMWFHKEEAQALTSVPLMGIGVGIFKDFLEKRQKLLALTHTDGAWFELLELQRISTFSKNTADYRLIDFVFPTLPGQEIALEITQWLMEKQEEIRILQMERSKCPPHQEGTVCRTLIDKKIKAIEKEVESRAFELAQKHMPGAK